ncbi:MAG: sodium:solute symporter family transporter [Vicinamibacterales bacterium]
MPILQIELVDIAVIILYLLGTVWLGCRLSGRQTTVDQYFLTDRTVPWWAVMFSIVATETSTVTFISVPGFAYAGDLTFLQIAFGYVIGRGLVTVLLMPTLFQRGILSVYELVRRYFGIALERTVSVLFITTRTLSDGLRLLGASIVLSFLFSVSGTPTNAMLAMTIFGLATVTVFYTWVGGMTAVVWVDVVQLGLYVAGALVAIGLMAIETPGGIAGALTLAGDAGKLSVFDFGFDVSRDYTFWSAVIGGAVFTAGTHGADQMFVQRYLACASLSQARRALFVSGLVVLVQFSLFLLLGLLLWAYYDGSTYFSAALPLSPDRVFAYFINTEFAVGLRGIMVAAVLAAAMSTLSSSLNSSAAAVVGNFLKRPMPHENVEERHLRVSRLAILCFGAIQAVVAIVGIAISERLIDDVLRIQFFSGGMMLGIFLLIAAGYRAPVVGAAGLVAGLSATVFLSIGTEVSWQWYACVGVCATFGAGMITDIARNIWT